MLLSDADLISCVPPLRVLYSIHSIPCRTRGVCHIPQLLSDADLNLLWPSLCRWSAITPEIRSIPCRARRSAASLSCCLMLASSAAYCHQLHTAIESSLSHFFHSLQAQEICRIPELLSDADLIGRLVWALDAVSGLWWPAEVLDPHDMPKGG